jgi:putative flippase GtrA
VDKKKLAELWTISRAAIVSIIGAAIEIVVLHFFLTKILPKWIAFTVVQVIANTLIFLSYKYWAFAAEHKGSTKKQYGRQILVAAGTWIWNVLLPSLFSYHWHMVPALAFAVSNVIIYLAWSYPLNRLWVFREVNPQAGAAPKS